MPEIQEGRINDEKAKMLLRKFMRKNIFLFGSESLWKPFLIRLIALKKNTCRQAKKPAAEKYADCSNRAGSFRLKEKPETGKRILSKGGKTGGLGAVMHTLLPGK